MLLAGIPSIVVIQVYCKSFLPACFGRHEGPQAANHDCKCAVFLCIRSLNAWMRCDSHLLMFCRRLSLVPRSLDRSALHRA